MFTRTLLVLSLVASVGFGQFAFTPELITPGSIPTITPLLNQEIFFGSSGTVDLQMVAPFGGSTFDVFLSVNFPLTPPIITGLGAAFINPSVPFILLASGVTDPMGFNGILTAPVSLVPPGVTVTLQALVNDGLSVSLSTGLELIWL